MNVKLILSADRKMCGFAPADEENNPTLILMVGCASERSVRKTIKREGHIITQIIDRGTALGDLVLAMGWPARIVGDQVEIVVSHFREREYKMRAIAWQEANPEYGIVFSRDVDLGNNLLVIKVRPYLITSI